MGKQLSHDPLYGGGPCRRCGLRYSIANSYVPCFEEGDTLETWRARQNEGVLAQLPAPNAAVDEKRDETAGAQIIDYGKLPK